MIADLQGFTDNFDNVQKVHDNVFEVLLDNLAVGVDPQKTHMFLQSGVPEISELSMLFMNLVTLQQLSQNPIIKDESKHRGFSLQTRFDGATDNTAKTQGVPMGFLGYPVAQAADILFCKANHVPVGGDQLSILELTRDIARKFNTLYGVSVFPEPQAILSKTPRLVGLGGGAKASKSLGNAIMLSDSPEVIKKKVNSMYTDPGRIKKTDPGNVEGSVVFTYLDVFDENKEEVAVLKQKYMNGGEGAPGDGDLKTRLTGVLVELLGPIQRRRAELELDKTYLNEILVKGNIAARERAAQTMKEVRAAMKIHTIN
jgi:tryptophanyl-tRNA synthetase